MSAQSGTFEYRGHRHDYLDHPYNDTRRNERAVEVPIALAFMDRQVGAGIEIGNVTRHYRPKAKHTVVDLDEVSGGVINADVRTWSPPEPFDWLVSVSTVEHVGWPRPWPRPDEAEPHAAAAVLDRFRQFVRPGRSMLITAPLGFNPGLDVALLDNPPEGSSTMVTDDGEHWREMPGIWWRPYGVHTVAAAAVWIWETP